MVLAQSVIDVCSLLLPGFAIMLVITWLVSLFRRG